MDERQASPELSQAGLELLLPTQEEQVSSSPPSRKRLLSDVSDVNDDSAEPRAKRTQATARLTRRNLALFNKMGKEKSSDPSGGSGSGSTKTLSTTASGFDIQAYKNGILGPSRSRPPSNLEDIHKRLAKTRTTASPPESAYEEYVEAVEGAPNEATLVYKDVGFNKNLSAPQPDFIEGVEMQDYHPFPVDEHVPGAVLYKDDRRSVTLPHIAREWKGPGGDMREATLQSGYDGAALVYARNQALAYQGQPVPPEHASITTFTTNGSHIHFYAHYAAPAEDGTLEYHQFSVKSTSLVSSHGEHKEGRRGLRNAQDHAKDQSYALKDQLKEHYKQQRSSSSLHPGVIGVPPLSVPNAEPLAVTQTYEHEDDDEDFGPQPVYQPIPLTSSKPRHNTSHHSHSHSTPHSSTSPSSTPYFPHSNGGKRKASSSQSSQGSSRHVNKNKSWKKDAISGRYYHKHSDGTVSFLDDEEDECD